jgi:hypothetical protein
VSQLHTPARKRLCMEPFGYGAVNCCALDVRMPLKRRLNVSQKGLRADLCAQAGASVGGLQRAAMCTGGAEPALQAARLALETCMHTSITTKSFA